MANSLTDYLELKLLDHSLGTTAYPKPTTVYCALFTSATTDAGGGTEVTGGAYARQAVTFAAASSGSASPAATINFPTATGSWGTITNIAFFDAVSGGNMLWHDVLTAAKVISTGDAFRIQAGNLTASLN